MINILTLSLHLYKKRKKPFANMIGPLKWSPHWQARGVSIEISATAKASAGYPQISEIRRSNSRSSRRPFFEQEILIHPQPRPLSSGRRIKKPYISSPFGWGLDGGSQRIYRATKNQKMDCVENERCFLEMNVVLPSFYIPFQFLIVSLKP
jgi:hypothetical protein